MKSIQRNNNVSILDSSTIYKHRMNDERVGVVYVMCTGRVRHRTISGMRTYSMYVVRAGHYTYYV